MYYDGYKYNEIAEALQEPWVPSKAAFTSPASC